jgi:pheromone shutdown-related protein TraB
MSDNTTRLKLGKKEIIIIGTAHISEESVEEVKKIIKDEKPDRVCVEIDETRYKTMTQKSSWKNMNITKILKQRRGFLLLSNLILASFQRRLGKELGIRPGEDMMAAIFAAKENNIPFSFCDREIQVTMRRAWAKSGFWGKNKMLAAMLGSIFSNEKLSKEELEELKKKSALHGMLEELAGFLPSVKEVLIDERDIFLGTKIFEAEGNRIVAVVGAGHVPGMVKHMKALESGSAEKDLTKINEIPPKGIISKILPWIIPAAIIGAIIANFFLRGTDIVMNNTIKWIVLNGGLSAIGSIIALAHPFTILLAFAAAPITSLIPVVGVGMFTGLLEAALKKPKVGDFENLHDDLTTIKGAYKNRFVHILIVFALSSVGSTIGTFLGGIPFFTSLFGG